MSFNTVDELLSLAIDWEQKLLACYEGIHNQIKNERTMLALDYLVSQQQKTVESLKSININEYKGEEYFKNIPDYNSEEIIPHIDISEFTTAEDLLSEVIVYEEKLKEFYDHLQEIAHHDKAKDLFEVFSHLKLAQIKNIKSLLDGWDLSA